MEDLQKLLNKLSDKASEADHGSDQFSVDDLINRQLAEEHREEVYRKLLEGLKGE